METVQAVEKAEKKQTRSKLQALLRALVGVDERFYVMLEKQAEIAHSASHKMCLHLGDGSGNVAAAAAAVQELEHQGDAVSRRLEAAIRTTAVTPLDREDLHRLSSLLDDVMDYANAAMRSCLLRRAVPTKAMISLIAILGNMTTAVWQAVSLLRTNDYEGISRLGEELRKLESQGDAIEWAEIAALYAPEQLDVQRILREEPALIALGEAINHAEDIGDLLVNLSVKYG